MVLGSIVTGLYFPPSSKYHVTASVAISLGFSIGYLTVNLSTDYLLNLFDQNWQLIQRVYGFVALICLILFCPLFTEKYAVAEVSSIQKQKLLFKETLFYLTSEQFGLFIKGLWLIGLFLNSIANSALVIHLVFHFF